MHRFARTLLQSALIAALAGCTGISFKQGAGGEDFRRAEAECRSTTSERNAFSRCMDEKGWWTRSMEELSQLGFAPVDEDAADIEDEAAVPVAAAAATGTAAGSKPAAAPSSGAAPAEKQAGAARPAAAVAAKAAVPKDPLSRLTIAMWAKAGADGSALMVSQAACLSTLGAGHEPDPIAKTVTRGLYDCLRKDGWTGMTLR
ncbi:hypothetical protein [Methyloversatilis sp.]|uniref:hypothetical protein n=1 Tax=Methyloversatilis sp. TaxID=2569862 RepID=UPI0027338F6C|nr:hypothetical protein [Methyloversatilis sp.]MDP2867954.1 hypothetical protein [Methyloversatilis sp.]MDP3288711.1 hypothetical protein [Methyloversatilis sp.]MDP3456810.1 hypothetical protein [Methyloversatilis sp.]MDP3576432.1 hypothetical protein [Methyloversatilis sp.]